MVSNAIKLTESEKGSTRGALWHKAAHQRCQISFQRETRLKCLRQKISQITVMLGYRLIFHSEPRANQSHELKTIASNVTHYDETWEHININVLITQP